MRRAGLADPAGWHTPESIAACGQCFSLDTGRGQGVLVAEKRGGQLWIHGAGASGGYGLAVDGLAIVEALADKAGCNSVAFQTGRPGLARIAKKQGYRITGFILEKQKS